MQLEKFGYNVKTLDELFSALPNVILSKIGKSIKRTPAIFLLSIDDTKYSLALAEKTGENEPTILQKESAKSLGDVLGKMLIYLNKSGLLNGE